VGAWRGYYYFIKKYYNESGGKIVKKRLLIINFFLLLSVISLARGETDTQDNFIREHYEFTGALDIRIHPSEEKLYPPAELLLIDQGGRKTGTDPRTHKTYMEIPHASYEEESISDAVSGMPGPGTKIINIRNPISGEYRLKVIGKESSEYDLEIRGYDCQMNPSHEKFLNKKILKNSEQEYIIHYSNQKGSKIRATPVKE
jgi:hypothetical protein